MQGLKFEIIPSLTREDLNIQDFANYEDFVIENAYRKVLNVAERLSTDTNFPDIIIGADTIVSLGGKVYGKPDDADMAFKYLEKYVRKC